MVAEGKRREKTHSVNEINLWRMILLLPMALLLRLWCLSLRFRVLDQAKELMQDSPNPSVFLIWHNRLFVAAEIYRRYRSGNPVYAVVSASKDGAWLSAFFLLMGIKTIRGSQNFRGTQALREIYKHLDSGKDIAITPDGSRGPIYKLKPGAVAAAKRVGSCILMTCLFEKSKQLNSWDRFYVPMPFSKVEFRAEELSYLDIKKQGSNLEAQALYVESRLKQLGNDL